MKFLAVFVTLAAVAFGFPATTTWTLNELSNAIQSPGTDPVLIPYLETALNQMMNALHQGQPMETITIAMPIVAEYTLYDLSEALQNPNTNPAHIPYLEEALNQIMAAIYAGEDKPSITVVLPGELPAEESPAGTPDFIDVWPVQIPEEAPAPVVPAPVGPPAPVESAPSSPLVQIIVNVQKEQTADVPVSNVIDRPTPVHVVDDLPGWGNFIEEQH